MLAALLSRYREAPAHLRLERRIELLGIALAALALVLLGLLASSALGTSRVASIAPSDDAIAVADAYGEESVDAQGSFDIRARPLFWASRRPQPSDAGEAIAASAAQRAADLKPLKFKLAGVFGAGSDNAGFIAVTKGQVRRVRIGETIEGWTVARVEPTAVELTGAGRRRVVLMERRPVVAAETIQSMPPADAASSPAEMPRVEPAAAALPDDPPRLTLGGSPPVRATPRRRDRRESQ